MDTIAAILCFVIGLIVLNNKIAGKVIARSNIPRQLFIILRILLSITFFLSFVVIALMGNDPYIFASLIVIGAVLFITFSFILIAFFITSKELRIPHQILENWWKHIVYATVTTIIIWLHTRDGLSLEGKNMIPLLGFPFISILLTIRHFTILFISAKHEKNLKPIKYCCLIYTILTILFFTLGGYRNTDRNYTIKESQKAGAFLWEYDIQRISKQIPDSLILPVEGAYAEKDFHHFRYRNWVSYERFPDYIGLKNYCVNILFEKDFTKHYDSAIEDSILAFYDYKRYCLTSKKHYDTIPPPDTIIFRFKYSLTPKGKAVTDTLLLTKRKSK